MKTPHHAHPCGPGKGRIIGRKCGNAVDGFYTELTPERAVMLARYRLAGMHPMWCKFFAHAAGWNPGDGETIEACEKYYTREDKDIVPMWNLLPKSLGGEGDD